ncbi:MAG: hypothetical protein U0003_05060 [Vampirovibrionales bacterium]
MTYQYPHPVAICTLADDALQATLQSELSQHPQWQGLLIAPLRTENLGIEQVITFALSQPRLRYLIVCGTDPRQAIGWLPGASLFALQNHGLLNDELHTIAQAPGKRPVLVNLSRPAIEAFRQQVILINAIGENNPQALWPLVKSCFETPQQTLPPYTGIIQRPVPIITGQHNPAITEDPLGYVVITTESDSKTPLVAEYFSTDGRRQGIVKGESPKAVYTRLIQEKWVSRLDHAAYIGQELARAEAAMALGGFYMQDGGCPVIPLPSANSSNTPL